MQQVELAPVAARERIEVMDVLRGFALLGILLMNMEGFVGPIMESLTGVNPRFRGADRWVDTAIYILVQGKFFTLFSLLFGMGFAVMLERANAAGSTGTRVYARRLLALLGIGLVHAILIWSGDILLTYSLLGFVLLLFFRRTPVSRLPKWGIALYLLPLALGWLWALGISAAAQDPAAAAEVEKGLAEQGRQMAAMAEAQRQAYGAGTWLQAVGQRAADTGMMVMFIVFGGGLILGMFLFGAWFVRSGAIRDVESRLPLYRRLRNLGFGIGLPLALWAAWRHPTMSFSEVSFDTALGRCAVRWTDAGISGVLLPHRDGRPGPAIEDGVEVPGFVFTSPELPAHWPRLDATAAGRALWRATVGRTWSTGQACSAPSASRWARARPASSSRFAGSGAR